MPYWPWADIKAGRAVKAAPKPQKPQLQPPPKVPTAKPGDPPPFERNEDQPEPKPALSGPTPDSGGEKNDPGNPNAASQNEAEAAGVGDNTTNPLADTDPSKDSIDDEPGQQLHETSSVGTGQLNTLVAGLQPLAQTVSPDSIEPVSIALTHLGDAQRQATFGQHRGAAMSVGHAVQALSRAVDAEPNPDVRRALLSYVEGATDVGNTILGQNEQRPPWNPLPVKSRREWKGLPVVEP